MTTIPADGPAPAAYQTGGVAGPPSVLPSSRPTRDAGKDGKDLAPWRGILWAVPFSILGWLLVIALVVVLCR